MHDSAGVESAWLRCGCNIRAAVIYGRELGAIGTRSMFVLRLNTGRLDVLFSCGPLLLGGLSRANTAVAAVVADASRIVIVVDDRSVVSIVNDGDIDVVHGAIVGKVIAIPSPTQIANANVTEPIIHAAIKSDVRSPITGVPEIAAVAPTPVAGCPKNADTGSQHPGPGHPVIIVVFVSPIAGRPDIALPRAYWLFVDRQFRRGNPYRDTYTDLRDRGRGYGAHDGSK